MSPDKVEKVIVYRSKWEQTNDEFWTSNQGIEMMFWLGATIVGIFIGAFIFGKIQERIRWKRRKW